MTPKGHFEINRPLLLDFREYDLSFNMDEIFQNPKNPWINMNCTQPTFHEIQCYANAVASSPSNVRKWNFSYYFFDLGMIKERSIQEINL